MRIRIDFETSGTLDVPYRQFENLQGLVFTLLSKYENISWLHNEGTKEKRVYKPLCYSHFIGNRKALKHNWRYFGNFSLFISSPLPAIILSIEKLIKERAYFRFCNKTIVAINYEIIDTETVKSNTFTTLSPIVCSTPITLTSGKIYQKFLNAFDSDFSRILQANLQNKAKAFYNLNLNGTFKIIPEFDESEVKNKFHLYNYKNSVIKAMSGRYRINADSEYIYVANNCGLGSRNALGFGLINILGEQTNAEN